MIVDIGIKFIYEEEDSGLLHQGRVSLIYKGKSIRSSGHKEVEGKHLPKR